LKQFFKKGHSVIVLGTGGVGKTTVAAALGMGGALSGLRTAAITIDPAQRLRDALGMRTLGGTPTRIDSRRLRRAGIDPDLELYAMVLDVRGRWDALVDRLVADPIARAAILHNRFYRSLAGQFAGSDAYAALEQLYDLHESGGFDLEIVDTPPAAQAFEFLQAPSQLVRLLDSDVTRLLAAGGAMGGGFAMRIAGSAARFVARELESFAGVEMLTSIADFFTSAAGASTGLLDRFRKADALLHGSNVHFVLVTTAERDRLLHAREMVREIRTRGLTLSAVVINRFLDEESWEELRHKRRGAAIKALDAVVGSSDDAGNLAAIAAWLRGHARSMRTEAARVEEFARGLPKAIRVVAVPALFDDAVDLAALNRIAGYLTLELPPIDHRTHRATSGRRRGAAA
jgi:anion-transporting  ArsA/GET3 family ATPase